MIFRVKTHEIVEKTYTVEATTVEEAELAAFESEFFDDEFFNDWYVLSVEPQGY